MQVKIRDISKTNLTLGYMSGGTGSAYPFNAIYNKSRDVLKDGIEGIDALVVWGGTDIHPSYYNQKAHRFNQQAGSINPINRDKQEWQAMRWARANNVPIIGVCRGAQMACVFAGGRLIQHVEAHNDGRHPMFCADGIPRLTNSVHHQMMFPFEVEHTLLGWAEGESGIYEDGSGNVEPDMKLVDYKEPEMVYFPGVRALAIQGHPEWMNGDSDFVQYCLDQVEACFYKEEVEVE